VLHMKYSFIWCLNMGTSEKGSEIPGRFSDVVLEKDGEDLCTDNARNEKVLHRVKEDTNINKDNKKEGRIPGLVTSGVGTAF